MSLCTCLKSESLAKLSSKLGPGRAVYYLATHKQSLFDGGKFSPIDSDWFGVARRALFFILIVNQLAIRKL